MTYTSPVPRYEQDLVEARRELRAFEKALRQGTRGYTSDAQYTEHNRLAQRISDIKRTLAVHRKQDRLRAAGKI